MGSSWVALARECFANPALNLLIESESVCFFSRYSVGNKVISRMRECSGCRVALSSNSPLRSCARVLQRINLARLLRADRRQMSRY